MSESRLPCPICQRPVGGTHVDFCPRSRVQKGTLRGPTGGRVTYLSKGVDISERDGEKVLVSNPGFPFVNTAKVRKDGKRLDWTAGGMPLGFDRESALEFMREKAVRPLSDFTPKQEIPDDARRQEPPTPSQDPQDQGAGEPNEDGQRPSAAPSAE